MIDLSLYVAYALVAIALLGSVVLPLVNSISQPKSLVKIGMSLLIIVVVYLVAFAISGGETAPYSNSELEITSSISKMIGGALGMMYLLLGVVIVGLVFSEVYKLLK